MSILGGLAGGKKGNEEGALMFKFDAATSDFGVKMQGVNKTLKDTANSAKKTGKEGQKAMTEWGKALNKAGGAAYDFGTQSVQSMTVMESLQEAVSGGMEMGFMAIIEDIEQGNWPKLLGDVMFGPMFMDAVRGNIVQLNDMIFGVSEERIEKEKQATIKGYSDVDFVKLIQHKMLMEDWRR